MECKPRIAMAGYHRFKISKTIYFLFIIHLLTGILSLTEASTDANNVNFEETPYLDIFVSPGSNNLELTWKINKVYIGDHIILYDCVKRNNYEQPTKLVSFSVNKPDGHVKTKVKFTEKIPVNYKKPVVIKYCATYVRTTFLSYSHSPKYHYLTSKYLQTYPNWMSIYWKEIKEMPLNKIFIPGTHDSVSYELTFSNAAKRVLNIKGKRTKNAPSTWLPPTLSRIGKCSMTQDKSILEQLILGIRYLHVRVYEEEDGQFFAVNKFIVLMNLGEVIDQVITFVTNAENNDIVIFDICEIDGQSTFNRENFKKFLINRFTKDQQRWFIPFNKTLNWTSTLEQLNGNPGRVIVSFPEKTTNEDDEIFWTSVQRFSLETRSIEKLSQYFIDLYTVNYSTQLNQETGHSAMAHLSKTNDDSTSVENAREDAENNSGYIIPLFLQLNIGTKTNILATDYFMGMGTVSQAILWNIKRFNVHRSQQLCTDETLCNDGYFQI